MEKQKYKRGNILANKYQVPDVVYPLFFYVIRK